MILLVVEVLGGVVEAELRPRVDVGFGLFRRFPLSQCE